MVRIVITAELARQLEQTREPVEIIDDQGHSVGYFTQQYSRAEILEAKRRAASATGGRTTDEVLERLTNLESQ